MDQRLGLFIIFFFSLLLVILFSGILSSPNYPGMYDNDIDYWVHIVGPSSTRLVFIFQAVDLEYQKDCLYDFVEVSPQLGTYLNLKITRDLFISSK